MKKDGEAWEFQQIVVIVLIILVIIAMFFVLTHFTTLKDNFIEMINRLI